MVVIEVEADSAAAEAGLKSGMLILKADQQAVTSVADLEKAVEKGPRTRAACCRCEPPRVERLTFCSSSKLDGPSR